MIARERERERFPMVTWFSRHAARARCVNLNGWVEAEYSGPMTMDTCTHLGRLVSGHAAGRSTIERLDKSMTMATKSTDLDISHLYGSLPGCYIVRPDQYEGMQAFCALLSRVGVMRLTFVTSQYELALAWSQSSH